MTGDATLAIELPANADLTAGERDALLRRLHTELKSIPQARDLHLASARDALTPGAKGAFGEVFQVVVDFVADDLGKLLKTLKSILELIGPKKAAGGGPAIYLLEVGDVKVPVDPAKVDLADLERMIIAIIEAREVHSG